ncbi:hypothetical protein ATCC90586_002530 [Pythium insidiosum]|nr:hypothetical protein ATCC90586_002530 [Pythium insidiosum]
MARRSRRVVDDDDEGDEGSHQAPQEPAAADVSEARGEEPPPSTPPPAASSSAKRKRDDGPPTNEEAELARRRRRRQSLVFQQRRKSLTLHSGGNSDDKSNRQYISDMYATVIKMSSENIYSYRVDDTWTSSYKILENLSRGGNQKKRGDDDQDDDAGSQDEDNGDDGDADEEATKTAKKKKSRSVNAARTIEKNLNNITLKQYEVEFEPDPLFHKMSQTFDEGGAKGMLLANLGVFDGVKLLLNSHDVPSNVTVSFYFICMLHLANEKGLRLIGQDDMSNFEIVKEEAGSIVSKKRTRGATG